MDFEKILKKDFVKFDPETKISKIAGEMRSGIDAVAVFQDEEFIGIISSNHLIDRDYPTSTKAKNLVIKNITKIEKEDLDSIKLAKTFLENNTKAVPVFENGVMEGLIFESDFITSPECLSGNKKNAEDIFSMPITIRDDENIGKARKLAQDKNVSRLPVVNDLGELVGIIDIKDFLKTINPVEDIRKGNIVPESKLSVTTIMDSRPFSIEGNMTCEKAVKTMKKNMKSYIIITEDKKPKGIITSKDILELLVSTEKGEEVYVQINGLKEIEDEFKIDKIDSMIEESVKKIGKITGPMEYFFVHVKSSQKEGEQKLFSIRTRMLTPSGLYVSKSSEWNPVTAVDIALERLERQIIEEHQKKNDLRSPRNN